MLVLPKVGRDFYPPFAFVRADEFAARSAAAPNPIVIKGMIK